MILDEITLESCSKGKGKRSKKVLLCSCDTCDVKFEVTSSLKKYKEKKNHFCSRKCMGISRKIGNVLYNRSTETSMKKYGFPFASMSNEIKELTKRTCLKKYGVEHHMFVEEIREKVKNTLLRKYGVENPGQSSKFKEKMKKTCVERYGVENPSQSKMIRDKIHETMKRNGSYNKSKGEEEFYDLLCEMFDEEDIERQVKLNSSRIDFYLSSIDTYIEFDGVYWHGLDRKIEEISRHSTERDKAIHKKWLHDRKLDFWCFDNSKKLVRITDVEFREMKKNKNFDSLKEKLLGTRK